MRALFRGVYCFLWRLCIFPASLLLPEAGVQAFAV
jgi:hypothetical protein